MGCKASRMWGRLRQAACLADTSSYQLGGAIHTLHIQWRHSCAAAEACSMVQTACQPACQPRCMHCRQSSPPTWEALAAAEAGALPGQYEEELVCVGVHMRRGAVPRLKHLYPRDEGHLGIG